MENRGQKIFDWINARLAEGMTVLITTYTHQTRISPRTAKSWAKDGLDLFKVQGESCFIARGKSWDCIDFCKISAV